MMCCFCFQHPHIALLCLYYLPGLSSQTTSGCSYHVCTNLYAWCWHGHSQAWGCGQTCFNFLNKLHRCTLWVQYHHALRTPIHCHDNDAPPWLKYRMFLHPYNYYGPISLPKNRERKVQCIPESLSRPGKTNINCSAKSWLWAKSILTHKMAALIIGMEPAYYYSMIASFPYELPNLSWFCLELTVSAVIGVLVI